jgi:hypothetical protein
MVIANKNATIRKYLTIKYLELLFILLLLLLFLIVLELSLLTILLLFVIIDFLKLLDLTSRFKQDFDFTFRFERLGSLFRFVFCLFKPDS